jgi:hypothetical protein
MQNIFAPNAGDTKYCSWIAQRELKKLRSRGDSLSVPALVGREQNFPLQRNWQIFLHFITAWCCKNRKSQPSVGQRLPKICARKNVAGTCKRKRDKKWEKKSSRFRSISKLATMSRCDFTTRPFSRFFCFVIFYDRAGPLSDCHSFFIAFFFRVFHYSARAQKVHRDEIRMRLFTARHRHVSFDRLKIFASVAVFFSRKVQLRRAERVFRVFLALRWDLSRRLQLSCLKTVKPAKSWKSEIIKSWIVRKSLYWFSR